MEEKNVNYIVLMYDKPSGKMSWGRCEDTEDIEIFKKLYEPHYPEAEYEVYKVTEKVN